MTARGRNGRAPFPCAGSALAAAQLDGRTSTGAAPLFASEQTASLVLADDCAMQARAGNEACGVISLPAAVEALRGRSASMTRSPMWLLVIAFAMTTLAGLLTAFQHVVREGVRGAAMRHQAMADDRDARWRCNTLRVRKERNDCVARLTVARHDPRGLWPGAGA